MNERGLRRGDPREKGGGGGEGLSVEGEWPTPADPTRHNRGGENEHLEVCQPGGEEISACILWRHLAGLYTHCHIKSAL